MKRVDVTLLILYVFCHSVGSCPLDADQYNDYCYWIGSSGSAQNCHLNCVSNGGRIAEIPDENAQQFLIDTYLSRSYPNRGDGIWIGVNDFTSEDVFTDWSGKPQNYFYWRSGQPNDDKMTTDQDCIAMFGGSENFEWQDKECEVTRYCLCSLLHSRSGLFDQKVDDMSRTSCTQVVTSSRSLTECFLNCARLNSCYSVNHNSAEDKCELNLCELTDTSLINRPGFTYYQKRLQ